ncbi:hypothetical protein JMG10_03215 [Nostoc ellipsosporum NOK]|nr:hypothetical protein [Nostoc ellipsosporum NOK]
MRYTFYIVVLLLVNRALAQPTQQLGPVGVSSPVAAKMAITNEQTGKAIPAATVGIFYDNDSLWQVTNIRGTVNKIVPESNCSMSIAASGYQAALLLFAGGEVPDTIRLHPSVSGVRTFTAELFSFNTLTARVRCIAIEPEYYNKKKTWADTQAFLIFRTAALNQLYH